MSVAEFSPTLNNMLFLLPVSCGDPTVPTNGSIDPYQNTTVGGQIVFRCDPGFDPDGDMTAVCAANGSWTPDPGTTMCTCESTYSIKTPPDTYSCLTLEPIEVEG